MAYSRLMMRVALAVAGCIASGLSGCGDQSDAANPPPQAAPTAPTAVPAPPAATQVASTSRPTIEPAVPLPPAPALRLSIELGSDNPYVGEPLPIRLYLSSPLAELLNDGRGREASPARPAQSPLSAVNPDWPALVRFALFRVIDDQLRPAAGELDWSRLRLPERRAIRGNPIADWEVPPSAGLPAGEYLLRATWDGAKSHPSGTLGCTELSCEARFSIAMPGSDQEKAEHAERLALLAYRESRFADARRLAEEAIKADAQSLTPQRTQVLLAQADACLAMDDFKAGLDIYRSILKLPLDDRLAADLTGKVRVLEKLVAQPRPRQTPARPQQ